MTSIIRSHNIEGVKSIEITQEIKIKCLNISTGDADRITNMEVILEGGEQINFNLDLDSLNIDDLFNGTIKTLSNLKDWIMVNRL